jgi:hypothetical protein
VKLSQVFFEDAMRLNAILKATELKIEFRRTFARESVDDPLGVAPGFNQVVFAEVREMLGDRNLLQPQDNLEVADTKLAVREEMKNPQARLIAKAFIDLHQFRFHTSRRIYLSQDMAIQRLAVRPREGLRSES